MEQLLDPKPVARARQKTLKELKERVRELEEKERIWDIERQELMRLVQSKLGSGINAAAEEDLIEETALEDRFEEAV